MDVEPSHCMHENYGPKIVSHPFHLSLIPLPTRVVPIKIHHLLIKFSLFLKFSKNSTWSSKELNLYSRFLFKISILAKGLVSWSNSRGNSTKSTIIQI